METILRYFKNFLCLVFKSFYRLEMHHLPVLVGPFRKLMFYSKRVYPLELILFYWILIPWWHLLSSVPYIVLQLSRRPKVPGIKQRALRAGKWASPTQVAGTSDALNGFLTLSPRAIASSSFHSYNSGILRYTSGFNLNIYTYIKREYIYSHKRFAQNIFFLS